MHTALNRLVFRMFYSVLPLFLAGMSVQLSADELGDIIQRIKPVGEVCIQGQDCKTNNDDVKAAIKNPVATAAPPAKSTGRPGGKIYNKVCVACHSSGIAGAPKVGDAAAWAPRVAKGMDVMMKNVKDGINAMPPKGTCGDCSDDELKAVVQYILDQST